MSMYFFHNTHSPISIHQHMLLKEQKYITIKQQGKGKQAEGMQRIDWTKIAGALNPSIIVPGEIALCPAHSIVSENSVDLNM